MKDETIQNTENDLDVEKFCRTCSCKIESDKKQFKIFLTSPSLKVSLIQLISDLDYGAFNILEDDGLPQQICEKCMTHVSTFVNFKRSCERAQEKLTSYFNARHNVKRCDTVENLECEKSAEDHTQNEILDDTGLLEEKDNEIIERYNIEILEIQNNTEICSNNKLRNIVEYEPYDIIETIKNSGKCDYESADELIECENSVVDLDDDQNEKSFSPKNAELNLENREELHNESCKDNVDLKGNIGNNESRNICKYCKEEHESEENLRKHIEKLHPINRPHLCPICHRSFQTVSNRNTHLQSHNEVDAYKCDICNQGFKSRVYVQKHKKAVHSNGEFECPICSQKFHNSMKFNYHVKSHSPNKKYKCKFCDKSFMQHHHLANHERTHTGLKPYLCNICGKDFKQQCNFKLHLRIHNGVRPYICSICGKDFVQRGSFAMHMRLHSGVRPYQCEICGKNFIQNSTLTVHLRTHTGEKPYKCDMCDKAFVQTHQLKYHKYSEHNTIGSKNKNETIGKTDPQKNNCEKTNEESTAQFSSPFNCPLCSKGFKLPSSLTSHMKSHSEERKYTCDQCGNSFKRAEHLRIHVNGVHLKQKPYACEYCNKRFSQSGDRNIHMKSHKHEKPFQCCHCNKRFKLQKTLRAHERIHTGEKPFTCEICAKDFMTYSALAVHTMKHTPAETKEIEARTLSELQKAANEDALINVDIQPS